MNCCDRCGRPLRRDNSTGRCAPCQRGGRPQCGVCRSRLPAGRKGGWCEQCQADVAPALAYMAGGGKRPEPGELARRLALYTARAARGEELFVPHPGGS